VARGDGLSLGEKSRDFLRMSNHSTQKEKGFNNSDNYGVLSQVGRVGVGKTIGVRVEASSDSIGEPHPPTSLPMAACQAIPLIDFPLSHDMEVAT
jgi:hypothetical protein